MKKITGIIAGSILAMGLFSCTITIPYAVTEHPIGKNTGVSKTTVILGAIQLNKDYGIAEAAKKGKIRGPVSIVDLKTSNYILFSTKELIITEAAN